MNKIISLFLASTLILEACDDNKTKETAETGKKGIEATDPKQNALQEIEKQKDELLKLPAMPAEELKALIPEILMGAGRTDHEVNSLIGTNVATGDYEINDSTGITLSIYDCAGPGGSGIYGMHMAGLLNDLHDNDQDYTKSVDFNDGKAYEQCDKTNFECTFSFFTGGRFLVTLEGHRVGIEALKQMASGLNIK